MEQDDDNDVRDLSDDDVDHQEDMDGDDESLDDVEKVNDLDFIAQHAAEPWVFSNDVSKEAEVVAVAGNNKVIEMNQSDDESEEEKLDVMVKDVSDNESSSDDESDILEMERKNTTKDSYTSHKTEVANWLTEEEDNIPSGPPRTRNEVDENYDVFDPNELDLAGRPILSTLLSSYHLCIYLTSHPRCVYLYHQTLLPAIFMKYYLHLPPRLPTSWVILPQQRILLRFDQ